MKQRLTVIVRDPNKHLVVFQYTGDIEHNPERLTAFLEGRRLPKVRKPKEASA